jgi:hypothetical protein
MIGEGIERLYSSILFMGFVKEVRIMGFKWLPIWIGIFLFLPQVSIDVAAASESDDAQEIFKPVTGTPEYESIFQEQSGAAGDIFGARRGYIHPFVSVGGYYTNNIFNSKDEKSDTVMVISPGIWLALPAMRQKLAKVETLNTAPGGLDVSRFTIETERRFQGYALYLGEFQENKNYQEAETDDHRAEALLSYRMRGGLSLELLDIYENDHDPFSTGDAGERQLDTFRANLLNPSISYRVSPKTRLRLDYSWYVLDYDSARRDYRDREDHAVSGYVFYQFAPKTSAFLDYEYVDIQYDNEERDNHENRLFGGLQWKATEKSHGRVKLGYGKKEFEESAQGDRDFFAVEAQLSHRFTRKSSVSLFAARRAGETDVQGARDVLTHRVKLGFTHILTAKLTGRIAASYIQDDYDGTITEDGQTGERKDDKYRAEVALGFAMNRWLNFSTGYVYNERDSNFNTRDYEDHTVYLHLTAAL